MGLFPIGLRACSFYQKLTAQILIVGRLSGFDFEFDFPRLTKERYIAVLK